MDFGSLLILFWLSLRRVNLVQLAISYGMASKEFEWPLISLRVLSLVRGRGNMLMEFLAIETISKDYTC